MADFRPLDGISKDDTQEAILVTLQAILQKLPRPDAATEFARVSGTVTATVNNATLNGGTVSTVTNQSQMGALPLNTAVFDFMRQVANPLYDQLVVT
jgi:hypothetical protein